jgi:anti-sigma regulatory factor (Ser/Thr protein kinase)
MNEKSSRQSAGKLSFETVADREHIEEMNNFVENALDKLNVRDEIHGQICTAVDEAVTNIALYAYPGKKGPVKITVEQLGCRIVITIIDSGQPFNPLHYPAPDINLSIEKRPIGGLGIHLMRHMMDQMRYRRVGDENCFTLEKILEDKK